MVNYQTWSQTIVLVEARGPIVGVESVREEAKGEEADGQGIAENDRGRHQVNEKGDEEGGEMTDEFGEDYKGDQVHHTGNENRGAGGGDELSHGDEGTDEGKTSERMQSLDLEPISPIEDEEDEGWVVLSASHQLAN